jgi:hypothetical protein
MCDNSDHTPFFQLMKPSLVKLNPYTSEPMEPENIPFNSNQVSVKGVTNWILTNLPDFTLSIESVKDLEDFKNNEEEKDINKVILFSKKNKTPPIFKVLSSEFRERIRFAFISNEKSPDVVSHAQVTDLPIIQVLKSFDLVENETLDRIETINYDKKELKLAELKEFINDYAKTEKKPAKEVPVDESVSAKKKAPRY